MTLVSKLVLIDSENNYLLMYRSEHPAFGNDPDLPGGTGELGEEPVQTCVREVYEEIGVTIDESDLKQVYKGAEYSAHHTTYALFIARCDDRPDITMSWEHSRYEWLDKQDFIEKSKNSNDTYMHMVAEVIGKLG